MIMMAGALCACGHRASQTEGTTGADSTVTDSAPIAIENIIEVETVSFEAPFDYQPYKERQYLFDHIWRQVKEKFYDSKLHGVDWAGYRKTYERFLPYINNNYDFRDMLSEMLGELNGSHTGARYRPTLANLPRTAHLGVFIDQQYDGDGLRIEEVIKRGPFAERNTGVKAGDIIEKIDGQTIKRGEDYNYMLDGKAGKRTHVTVYNPKDGKRRDIIIKPAPGWKLVDEDRRTSKLQRESFFEFPLIFFGNKIKAEKVQTPVTTDCIAPTIAHHIRIRAPNACNTAPLF